MTLREKMQVVLDVWWSASLEGQAPSGEWLYRKMRKVVSARTLSPKEETWLRDQLHSPAMQCRQCALVLRLLGDDNA